MKVYRSLDEPLDELSGCAVAIGNFDGVHAGHRRLIETVRALAGPGGQAVLLTFEPHPARVLSPEYAPRLITSPARKLALLEETGLDAVVVQPFDRTYAGSSPEDFVRGQLVGKLGARDIVVGHDFTFGKGRAGTPQLLASLATPEARVHVVPAVTLDGLVVSSSKIRELVLEGRVAPAARLLQRAFVLDGTVVPGRGRGRTIGFPTANVAPDTELLPGAGVYAVMVASAALGGVLGGAANVGVKPTFGGGDLTVEVHVLGATADLYGHRVAVAFLDRLRGEERFPGPEALAAQIERDVARAREVVASAGTLRLSALSAS